MDTGLLSLKWNNHSSTFFDVLETIRRKGLYSDVTIACDGKYFDAHKLVLSTCSDYFQEMFEKTQCKHPIVVLKDISYTDLEFLLNYMYVGEVNVLQNELSSLIKAAECLRVKGLAVPDEPPSNRKSSKRSTSVGDREESSNKKNKRSVNTSSTERTSSTSSANNDETFPTTTTTSNTSYSPSHNQNSRSSDSNCHPSKFQEYDTSNIKEEVLDQPSDSFIEDGLGNVKFEQFDDVHDEQKNVHSPIRNSNDSFSSQLETSGDQRNSSANQLMPSTSGYTDASGWSGIIETIGDDENDGCEVEDMGGNYNPNAFLDSSQAKSQMMWPYSHSILGSLEQETPTSAIHQFIEKRDSFWACTFAECSYHSIFKNDLIKHIRRHIGEKPFACTFCPYRTNDTSNLRKHNRKRHMLKQKDFSK